MLDPTAVEVDRRPVIHLTDVERNLATLRITVPIEVPGRIHEGIHRVCLASRCTAAAGTSRVDELWYLRERRITSTGELLNRRQLNRKIVEWDRLGSALVAIDDRNRCTPVSLARDTPVLQTKLYLPATQATLLRRARHQTDGVEVGHSRKFARISKDTGVRKGLLESVAAQRRRPVRLNNNLDVETILPRKFKISLVVCWNRHNGTGPVIRKNKICNPDWNCFAGKRINSSTTSIETLFLDLALESGLAVERSKAVNLRLEALPVDTRLNNLIHKRMFGC